MKRFAVLVIGLMLMSLFIPFAGAKQWYDEDSLTFSRDSNPVLNQSAGFTRQVNYDVDTDVDNEIESVKEDIPDHWAVQGGFNFGASLEHITVEEKNETTDETKTLSTAESTAYTFDHEVNITGYVNVTDIPDFQYDTFILTTTTQFNENTSDSNNVTISDGNITATSTDAYWESQLFNKTVSSHEIRRVVGSATAFGTNYTAYIREDFEDSYTNLGLATGTYKHFQLKVELGTTSGSSSFSLLNEFNESGRATTIALSDDGGWVACGIASNPPNYVVVYDTSDYSEVVNISTADTVESVEISPNKKYLAVGIFGNHYSIYNTSDWSIIENVSSYGKEDCVFSHDNSYFATDDGNDYVEIYDTSDWTLVQTLDYPSGNTDGLSWSGDDSRLAVSDHGNNTVYIYDTSSWTINTKIEDAGSSVTDTAWDSNNGYLASAEHNGKIRIYDDSDWSLVDSWNIGLDYPQVTFDATGDYLAWGGNQNPDVEIYYTSNWSLYKTLDAGTDLQTDDGRAFDFADEANYFAKASDEDDVSYLYNTVGSSATYGYISELNIVWDDTADFKMQGTEYNAKYEGFNQSIGFDDVNSLSFLNWYGDVDFEIYFDTLFPVLKDENAPEVPIIVKFYNASGGVMREETFNIGYNSPVNTTISLENITDVAYYKVFFEPEANDFRASSCELDFGGGTITVELIILLYYETVWSDFYNFVSDTTFWAIFLAMILTIGMGALTRNAQVSAIFFVFLIGIFTLVGYVHPFVLYVTIFGFAGLYAMSVRANRSW